MLYVCALENFYNCMFLCVFKRSLVLLIPLHIFSFPDSHPNPSLSLAVVPSLYFLISLLSVSFESSLYGFLPISKQLWLFQMKCIWRYKTNINKREEKNMTFVFQGLSNFTPTLFLRTPISGTKHRASWHWHGHFIPLARFHSAGRCCVCCQRKTTINLTWLWMIWSSITAGLVGNGH